MISEQRLEELIKQGATIYYIFEDVVFNTKEIIPITLNDGASFDITTAFETEEDARWELEMTATRTETLKLPTWEEFNNQEKQIKFSKYPCNYACYIDLVNIGITEYYGMDGIEIFNKPATKENYIEACKLCLRLFRGEEV